VVPLLNSTVRSHFLAHKEALSNMLPIALQPTTPRPEMPGKSAPLPKQAQGPLMLHGFQKARIHPLCSPTPTRLLCSAHGSPHPWTIRCCKRRHKPTSFVAPPAPSNLLLSAEKPAATCKRTPGSILCYSAGARRPASPWWTEAQHFPLHPPEGKSMLPRQRAGTLSPLLIGNLLLCGCQEVCFPMVHRGPALPHWGEESNNLNKNLVQCAV
jgi:hypothetical protein